MTVPRFSPIQVLHLFNAKAAELNDSRLVGSMRAGKGSHRISLVPGQGLNVEHDMPHQEELQAFVLTFRQFLVQKEPFSFVKLAALYRRLGVRPETKTRAAAIITRQEAYLDAPSTIVMDHVVVSRRRVLDVGLYGGLAHSYNADLMAVRQKWAANPALDVTLWDQLLDILMQMTQMIFLMRHVNLDAIKELEASDAAK